MEDAVWNKKVGNGTKPPADSPASRVSRSRPQVGIFCYSPRPHNENHERRDRHHHVAVECEFHILIRFNEIAPRRTRAERDISSPDERRGRKYRHQRLQGEKNCQPPPPLRKAIGGIGASWNACGRLRYMWARRWFSRSRPADRRSGLDDGSTTLAAKRGRVTGDFRATLFTKLMHRYRPNLIACINGERPIPASVQHRALLRFIQARKKNLIHQSTPRTNVAPLCLSPMVPPVPWAIASSAPCT